MEATLTGGSSGSAGPSTASAPASASRKRRPEVDIEDIDPNAGADASSPSVVVEAPGTKSQAERSVADIDPQSGDGTDIANLVFAHPGVSDLLPGKVGCQSRTRAIAAPEVGVSLTGVVGGSDSHKAKQPQRHGPEQRIFGNRIPRMSSSGSRSARACGPDHSSE